MKDDDKIIKTHYLSLSYNTLINKKIIHLLLFLIEIIMIITQISEIHQKYYKLIHIEDNYNFYPISNLFNK